LRCPWKHLAEAVSAAIIYLALCNGFYAALLGGVITNPAAGKQTQMPHNSSPFALM